MKGGGAGRSMQSVASAAQAGEQASSTGFKVAVLGAAGGIGQPLSLLMNMQPLVGELALYDVANTKGVAADLGHCNTPVAVTSHEGEASLASALDNAHLVIIPAGVPRKPGSSCHPLCARSASRKRAFSHYWGVCALRSFASLSRHESRRPLQYQRRHRENSR